MWRTAVPIAVRLTKQLLSDAAELLGAPAAAGVAAAAAARARCLGLAHCAAAIVSATGQPGWPELLPLVPDLLVRPLTSGQL